MALWNGPNEQSTHTPRLVGYGVWVRLPLPLTCRMPLPLLTIFPIRASLHAERITAAAAAAAAGGAASDDAADAAGKFFGRHLCLQLRTQDRPRSVTVAPSSGAHAPRSLSSAKLSAGARARDASVKRS